MSKSDYYQVLVEQELHRVARERVRRATEQMTVARRDGETVELRAEYRAEGNDSASQERLGLRRDQGYFAARDRRYHHGLPVTWRIPVTVG